MPDIFQDFRKLLRPSKWDCWQTLIWISVFSWGVSLLAGDLVQSVIAAIGGLFLIAGIHWGLHEEAAKKALTINKLLIAPWFTGALLCLFLGLTLLGGFTPEWIKAACLGWAPLSAILASLPSFIGGTKDGPQIQLPEVKVRRSLIHLLLINLLISCWFQLYFVIQTWIMDYPSIISQDLRRSAFVVKLTPGEPLESRGKLMLQQAEALLQANLANRPWSQVEGWLYDLRQKPDTLDKQVMARLTPVPEDSFWVLNSHFLAGEYNLELVAQWQGPSLDGKGFYLQRVCQIVRLPNDNLVATPRTSGMSSTELAAVECGPMSDPLNGKPTEK